MDHDDLQQLKSKKLTQILFQDLSKPDLQTINVKCYFKLKYLYKHSPNYLYYLITLQTR